MKSAITNIGRQFISTNTTGGAWFSITHFALAWVNSTERTNNPASEDATELILTHDDGESDGDYIFNIWQTPFVWNSTGASYGVGTNMSEGFGNYFKYEYDECSKRNTLQAYYSDSTLADLEYGFKTTGVVLYGASEESSSGEYSGGHYGQLTLSNIPAPLYYDTATATTLACKKYSKYFPIKSFSAVETTDDTIDAKVSLMNYQLELPAITSQIANEAYTIANSIGNFKFNRIGLYVTKSTYPDPIDKLITALTPVADKEEPVLFAIIDLSTSNELCSDSVLDIFKTRDDSGLASFTYDAQVSLSSVNSYTYPNVWGTELVSYDGSIWTLGNGWSGSYISGFTHTPGNTIDLSEESASYVIGGTYKIDYTISNYTTGYVSIHVGGIDILKITSTGSTTIKFSNIGDLIISPSIDFDGTVIISIKQGSGFAGYANMYVDTVRDEATNFYLNQIEATANTTEAIMQLQLQIAQIGKYLNKLNGTNPIVEIKQGINSIALLQMDSEYYLGNTSKNVYYFKGDYFRASDTDNTIINNANAQFNIYNAAASTSTINDGDELNIIIDNLDGRYYTTNATTVYLWSGKIYVTNYTSKLKQKLLILDSSMLKGATYAKINIKLVYSSTNSSWIVSEVNIFDEKNIM